MYQLFLSVPARCCYLQHAYGYNHPLYASSSYLAVAAASAGQGYSLRHVPPGKLVSALGEKLIPL